MPTNSYWGGTGAAPILNLGIVPPTGATHLDPMGCTALGLAGCLNSMASYKDMWCCGDEGTVPFNYFLWVLEETTPVDKYAVNTNMVVKGAPVRGHIVVIKLDAAPSETAAPVSITQVELDTIVAANQLEEEV